MIKMYFSFVLLLLSADLLTEGTKKDHDFNYNFSQIDYNIKLERAEMVSYSKDYFKYCSVHTFKYNRTCTALNVTFSFKIDLMEELDVIIQAYKFMSNEYRYFPIHFQMNVCKALNANMGGLRGAFKCENTTTCPFLKEKKYHMDNWFPNHSKFPPFIPSGSFMVEGQLLYRSNEVAVFRGYAIVSRPEV